MQPDEDGVTMRSEEDHRRIFQPYASTSPFAAAPVVQERKMMKKSRKMSTTQEEEDDVDAVNSSDAKNGLIDKAGGGGAAEAVAVEEEEEKESDMYITRKFSFGHFGPLYHWMARVGAMADHYAVYPDLDWFFMEINAAVPLTRRGLNLAWYMTDEEAMRGESRNVSDVAPQFQPEKSLAVAGNSDDALSPDKRREIEEHALGQFCWLIAGDAEQRDTFTGDIYLQWYHRADYLVSRKAKEYTEYRNNLTLGELLQSASQNRKRRKQRREDIKADRDKFKPMPDTDLPPHFLRFKTKEERAKIRQMQMYGIDGRDGTQPMSGKGDEVTAQDLKEMAPSRHQFVIDTLPREVREALEADNTYSGLGGGVRQQDPMEHARAASMPGGMHSGGSWHM